MCVTDILPTVAGMIVENHIDVVEYLNQVVGKEMNGLKDNIRNGKIKWQGSRGEKGERGTDGTGLTLKSFKINQTYHHGDYVFSKSSKDGYNSMFIAEKTFIATTMPYLDLASGNWGIFHAPRGLRGSSGDRGATGMAGATGPRGKDIIDKAAAKTIRELQDDVFSLKKKVEKLDPRNSSCPHLDEHDESIKICYYIGR